MGDKKTELSYFDMSDIIQSLLRWKIHLIVIASITIVVATVFSGPSFIEPKFKSYAILYPSNIIPYGSESQVEQMLQILQSDDIKQQIFSKFNLMQHYGIDAAGDKYAMTHLRTEFDENVSFAKTEYESVEIIVIDKDAKFASMMCDSIIDIMNKKAKSLQREKSEEVVKIYKDQLDRKKIEMDSMENALKDLRTKYGILNYDEQVKVVTKEYLKTLSHPGNAEGTNEAKKMMENLQQKGGEFSSLNEHLWRVRGNYNDIKQQYENAIKDVDKILTYSNVITSPFPAEKKSYPVRWLLVVFSTLSTLLVSFLVIIYLERRLVK